MVSVRTAAAEIVGLFIDDGRFAVTMLIWVGLAGLALPRLPLAAWTKGPILFAGLTTILVESVFRRARS